VAMENGNEISDKDTLFMLSGVALVVFGAGLILSNPIANAISAGSGWEIWLRPHCRIWIAI
jgi:hypothetical protein